MACVTATALLQRRYWRYYTGGVTATAFTALALLQRCDSLPRDAPPDDCSPVASGRTGREVTGNGPPGNGYRRGCVSGITYM